MINILEIFKSLKYMFISIYIMFFLFLNTPLITFFFRDPDQGAQLAKGMEILNGIHPFINIKGNIYGPLVFYMSALGQLVSGNRLIGEVIIILSGYFVAYFLVFHLTERISKKFFVAFILLTVALTLLPRFYKYYIVLGPALFIHALFYYIYNRKGRMPLIYFSLSVGINILFRFDFGFYSILVLFISILLIHKNEGVGFLLKILSKAAFYISIMVIPWVIFVVVKSGNFQKFFELFSIVKGIGTGLSLPIPVFNLSESFLSNYNNFSMIFWLFRLLPFFVLIILFFIRSRIKAKESLFVFTTSVYCVLIFIQALHRTSVSHLFQVIPITFILLGWMIRVLMLKKLEKPEIIKVPIVMLLIFFTIGWVVFINNNRIIKKYDLMLKKWKFSYKSFILDNKELRDRFRENKNINIVNLVTDYTKRWEPVLFIPIESQLYYFSERLFRVSMGVLGPGRLKSEREQIDFFDELKQSGTNIIVDRPFFFYDNMPKRNPRHYYPVLMKLIYGSYRIVERSGDSVFLCNDNRFDDCLKTLRHEFTPISNFKFYKKLSGVKISVDSINTFLPEQFDLSIHRNSFLYVKGRIKYDIAKYEGTFFLGIKHDSKIYLSEFKLSKKIVNGFYEFELFSSLKSVYTDCYELVLVYKTGERFFVANSNVVLTVI